MEKIWIAGAKGHVGSALCDLLDCRHYEILPTDLEEVDITDRESVSNYVRVSRPDVLINCVGLVILLLVKPSRIMHIRLIPSVHEILPYRRRLSVQS